MTIKELSRRRFLKSASGLLLVPAFDILVPKLRATNFLARPAVGGGGVSFSDDFNTGADLSASWTEVAGGWDISASQARTANGSSWINNIAIYTGTACSSVDQYAKVTISGGVDRFHAVIFRYSNSSSPMYVLYMDTVNGRIQWAYYPDSSTGSSAIANATTTVGVTDTWGFTVEGTGTSTVVRGWRNPTANAPTSMSSWDGGAATVTFTDDPATAVNSGNNIGLGGEHQTAQNLLFDNFYGGNL